MKNIILWIAGGALAAYLLMPEKVKEVVSGATGGSPISIGGLLPDINFPEIKMPNITMPNITMPDFSNLLGNLANPVPNLEEALKKTTDNIVNKVKEAIPAIPTEISNPFAAADPLIKDVWGKVKTAEANTWLNWQERAAKGVETGFNIFDWLGGGWQTGNRATGQLGEWLVNFFDPHRAVTLTPYASNILAGKKQLKDTYLAPLKKVVAGTYSSYSSIPNTPAITSQEQLSSLPMYIQREYW